MLSEQVIQTVKATAPLLAEQGKAITDLFYHQLFTHHPELKHIFNMANQAQGEQSKALAESIFLYASRIDELAALGPMVTRIAHKHASLHILPAHYPIVGKYLLLAIQEHLQLPDDHVVLIAWADAYAFLAQIFVSTEEAIYSDNEHKTGGWRGFKAFTIDKIVVESVDVKSFYLVPEDGRLVTFTPGQYIGVKLQSTMSGYDEIRQYSLSNAPGEAYYRITVKAESHCPNVPGVVSNHLHQCQVGDVVWVQPPTGDFHLRTTDQDVVFIAGGVGITPLLSMLLSALATMPEKITLIQCVRDAQHHIMKEALQTLQARYGFKYYTVYDQGDGADVQGRLTTDVLKQWLPSTAADVYFCGPKGFMASVRSMGLALNFGEHQLHYEVFGPTTQLV